MAVMFLTNSTSILNQLHASHSPARDWFLEIAFVHDVSMHVCVPAPKGIYVNGPCMTS